MKKYLMYTLVAANVFLISCGQRQTHSLYDKVVPVNADGTPNNSSSSASEDDIADESNSTAQTPIADGSPTMSLKAVILANSDVPEEALDQAFDYYDNHQSAIRNKHYITIFNIGAHSGKKRLYVINLDTGATVAMHAAHGKNSDSDNDGYATQFSNTANSLQSSLGFMLTNEIYNGEHGGALRLDGQENRNSNVRARGVVMHGAAYVGPHLSKMGRSWGCPAVSNENIAGTIAKIKGGSLFYSYHQGMM